MFLKSGTRRPYLILAVSFSLCLSLVGPVSAQMPLLPQLPPTHAAVQFAPYQKVPLQTHKSLEQMLTANNQRPKLYSTLTCGSFQLTDPHQYAIVEPLCQASLLIFRQTKGNTSVEVGITLNNLAWIHEHLNRYVQAEHQYLGALSILALCPGDNAIMIAVVQQNLADMYVRENKAIPALSLYRKSVATLERRLGSDHPATQAVDKKYAAIKRNILAN